MGLIHVADSVGIVAMFYGLAIYPLEEKHCRGIKPLKNSAKREQCPRHGKECSGCANWRNILEYCGQHRVLPALGTQITADRSATFMIPPQR